MRRCEVRRERLCGLPRVVRREEAVPRMLRESVYDGRTAASAGLGDGNTEACLPDRCRPATRAEASKGGDQPASCRELLMR